LKEVCETSAAKKLADSAAKKLADAVKSKAAEEFRRKQAKSDLKKTIETHEPAAAVKEASSDSAAISVDEVSPQLFWFRSLPFS
jgi:hypothetical protein